MAINDLHVIYPNRNNELRSVAKQCFEFGQTIAREPSAAHSNGLDVHAIERQRQYIAHAADMIEALNDSPIPDRPGTHPTDMPINFSDPYVYFTQNVGGEEIPMNEATQLLAESWLLLACGMAKSQSAGIAGSLVEYDYNRGINNVNVIEKLLNEIENRPFIDLPETALPGSAHGKRSGGTKKTAAR